MISVSIRLIKLKCIKKTVDKLVEECIENVEEVKLSKITSIKDESKHKCNFFTLHIALFSILFPINVGIGNCFIYFSWYSKIDVTCVTSGARTQATI